VVNESPWKKCSEIAKSLASLCSHLGCGVSGPVNPALDSTHGDRKRNRDGLVAVALIRPCENFDEVSPQFSSMLNIREQMFEIGFLSHYACTTLLKNSTTILGRPPPFSATALSRFTARDDAYTMVDSGLEDIT
jgi:hypothetical protein